MELTSDRGLLETTTGIANGTNITTESPWMVVVTDIVLLSAGSSGVVLNAFTLIALFWASSLSTVTSLLLKHQAFLDLLVCLLASCIIIQPPMWGVGNPAVDQAICHIWHSQGFYWGVIFLAAWNLVVLATDRMLAICKPFTYAKFTRPKVICVFVALYTASLICNLPAYFEVKLVDGECKEVIGFKGTWFGEYYFCYALFYFVLFYFFPCALFSILYGMIIVTLKRKRSSACQSNVIDSVAAQLTRSAIVVTVIFMVTIGPDSWIYLLSTFQITKYEYNSPLQKVMVFLTMLNSCSNPVVYLCTLPPYRRDVLRLLRLNRIHGDSVSEDGRPTPASSVTTYARNETATTGGKNHC